MQVLLLCLCLVGTALASHGPQKSCKVPYIPRNGGLVCLTLNLTRYCKPMCNKNHDFEFLRRSRLFEKCGPSTFYQWTTQYIGGLRLADCSRSMVQISALRTSYFENHCKDKFTENKKIYEKFWEEVNQAELRPASTEMECKKPHCTNPAVLCH